MKRWLMMLLPAAAMTTGAVAQTQRSSNLFMDNDGRTAIDYSTRAMTSDNVAARGTALILTVPTPVRANGCGHAFAIVSRLGAYESGCVGR